MGLEGVKVLRPHKLHIESVGAPGDDKEVNLIKTVRYIIVLILAKDKDQSDDDADQKEIENRVNKFSKLWEVKRGSTISSTVKPQVIEIKLEGDFAKKILELESENLNITDEQQQEIGALTEQFKNLLRETVDQKILESYISGEPESEEEINGEKQTAASSSFQKTAFNKKTAQNNPPMSSSKTINHDNRDTIKETMAFNETLPSSTSKTNTNDESANRQTIKETVNAPMYSIPAPVETPMEVVPEETQEDTEDEKKKDKKKKKGFGFFSKKTKK